MPKFIQEIIENHFWKEISFEIPDFPENDEDEIVIPDAFVEDDIVTM